MNELEQIRRAFRAFIGQRNLVAYDFPFEHDQYWVIHLPSGKTWSVVDTNNGPGFELIEEGEEV